MIKRIVFGSFATLLIILLGFIVFIGTPFGLKTAVALTRKLTNNHVQIYQAEGSLMGKVSFSQIRIITKHQRLELNNIELNWRPIYLFALDLDIKKLNINKVTFVKLKNIPDTSSSSSSFHLPIDLNIEQIKIDQVHFYDKPANQNYTIADIGLHAIYNQHKLDVSAKSQIKTPYKIYVRLNINGKPDDYKLDAHITTPIVTTRIDGKGDQKQIALTMRETSELGGQLTGSTSIQWQPTLAIQSNLLAKKIQLGDHWISGPIKINYHGLQKFNVDTRLTTSLGNIDITGHHDKQWDVKWNIQLDKLERLSPLLMGSIHGKGTISGDTLQPSIRGNIQLKQLAFEQNKLDNLSANWDVVLHQNKPSTIQLRAKTIHLPGIDIDEIQSKVQGTLAKHQATLQLKTSLGEFQISSQGSYDSKQQSWQALISTFNLIGKPLAHWKLQQPIKLTIDNKQQSIAPFCWTSTTAGKLCLSLNNSATWSASINGHLNLSAMPGLAQDDLHFAGKLMLDGQAKGDKAGLSFANVNMTGQQLTARLGQGPLQQTTRFTSATTNFSLIKKTLSLQQNLSTSNGDYLKVNISAKPIHHLNSDANPKLTGTVNLLVKRLQNFQYSLPPTISPQGQIQANLNISGRLNNPAVKGVIDMTKAKVELPDFGITFSNGLIIAHTLNDNLNINAKLYSNGKPLRISSKARMKNYSFDGSTQITGDSIPVINTMDYQAVASPKINITIKHKLVDITGDINIPSATISPKNFNSTVTLPTSDIVYVNQAPSVPSLWKSQMKLRATMGDNVNVNSYGVTGKLLGALEIIKNPGQPMTGNGKISMKDGKFDAHGAKLDISSASVIFRNSPLENPELDVTASRTLNTYSSAGILMLGTENLTVGVHVTGHANHPKLSFFSTPVSLNQTDILSYMILGHASGGGSAADLTLLINAFNSGGTGGIGNFVGGLEKGLGLAEFGVQSETALDISGNPIDSQNSFVVGKYLTPKIYLRYSRGLVDQNNTVLLRYMITPKWAIQTTQSNLGTGGDIIYTFYRH